MVGRGGIVIDNDSLRQDRNDDRGQLGMSSFGDPDSAFGQLIGTTFHPDAFEDHDTIDEIVDDRLSRAPAGYLSAVLATGRRLLCAGHDDATIERILRRCGFAFLVVPLGYASYTAFLEHLVGRLSDRLASMSVEEFAAPDDIPAREPTDAELDALTTLLSEAFSEPSEDEIETVLACWAVAHSVAVLESTRSGAQAVRRLPLDNDELLAFLHDLGLGFDPLEHEGIYPDDFLVFVDEYVSRALGDPPS